MKKFIFLISLALLSAGISYGQLWDGRMNTETVSSTSATPVYITLDYDFTGKGSLVINGLCTQVSGTSEGTILLQARASEELSWITLNATSYPALIYDLNDTVTVANGTVFSYVVPTTYWEQYRLKLTGGASDATDLDIGWMYKK
jgi:hypothetical protein